jgi:hypothetical protein
MAVSRLTQFGVMGKAYPAFTAKGAAAPVPPVVESNRETPAGRSRRRRIEVFRVRYKGEDREFVSTEGLLAYLVEVRADAAAKPRKGKPRAVVKITVPPEFQKELYSFDLPDIRPMVKRLDLEAVQEVMSRFHLLSVKRAEDDDDEEESEWLLLY